MRKYNILIRKSVCNLSFLKTCLYVSMKRFDIYTIVMLTVAITMWKITVELYLFHAIPHFLVFQG